MNRNMTGGVVLLTAAAGAAIAARRRPAAARIDARDLAGKTAVVTGAGSGIGRSLALLLAERGAAVHAADINQPAAQAVAGQIKNAGGQATAHGVDVATPAPCSASPIMYSPPGRSTCCSTTRASGWPAR